MDPVELLDKCIKRFLDNKSSLLDIISNINGLLQTDLKIINSEKIKCHFWTYLSKENSRSVKFIKQLQNEDNNINGNLWIMLNIYDKTLQQSINDLYNEKFDSTYYLENSRIKLKKTKILQLLQNIDNLDIRDKIPKVYNNYINDYKNFKAKLNCEKQNNDFLESIDFQLDKNKYESRLESNFYFTESEIVHIGDDSVAIEYKNAKINSKGISSPNPFKKSPASKIKAAKSLGFAKNTNFIKKKEDKDFAVEGISSFKEKYKPNYYFNNNISNNINLDNNKNKISIYDLHYHSDNEDGSNNVMRNFPYDKHFQIQKKTLDNEFTENDLVLYDDQVKKLTNSVLFYLNNFYNKKSYYRFKVNNLNNTAITLKSQNYQCYTCNKQFKTFLSIPVENIYWCSYYLRFICKNCVSDKLSIIPDFVLTKWSFEKYPVSKKAYDEINKYMNMPIIYLSMNSTLSKLINKKNESLIQACILKRKIHIIYDLMKCPEKDKTMKDILKAKVNDEEIDYSYLVLNDIIFSLQDLLEINQLTFIGKLKIFFEEMKKHVTSCPICGVVGKKCCQNECKKNDLLFAFDFENVFYCNKCKNLWHNDCFVMQSLHQCCKK